MSFNTIIFTNHDGLAWIQLNRPERLNSFTREMHCEVRSALDVIEQDESIRVLVLTGTGRGFCAGQDLGDRQPGADNAPPDLGESLDRDYNPLIRRLINLPVPVICGINGVAAGAGVSIALACDIAIAASTAKFVLSFSKLGLVPDSGASWLLPKLIGQSRALGLALTGEPISADQAERWGLIWASVDADLYPARLEEIAIKLASGPTRGLAATSKLVRSASQHSLEQHLDLERDTMKLLGQSRDYQEGVAAFTQKRPPRFKGY